MKINHPYLLFVLVMMACTTPKPAAKSTDGKMLDKQGHRGARGLMPENTIPAMLVAIDLGVTTLEMDVVITKDRQVVLSHDVYFHENITTTPEGKTLSRSEAQKRLIYTMTYDSVSRYDVGMKPHPDFPRQKKMAVVKPMLRSLIQDVEANAKSKDREMFYNIEIKSKPENDGTKHPPIEEFVDLVVAVINEEEIASRTNLQSFDMRALQVARKKYPRMALSLLMEATDKRSLDEQVAALGFTPEFYSPHYSMVNAELVKACRDKKMKLVPWTVNKLEEMRKLKDLGVDGIISDYPDLFSQL